MLMCFIVTSRQLCLPSVRSFTWNVSHVFTATNRSTVAFSIQKVATRIVTKVWWKLRITASSLIYGYCFGHISLFHVHSGYLFHYSGFWYVSLVMVDLCFCISDLLLVVSELILLQNNAYTQKYTKVQKKFYSQNYAGNLTEEPVVWVFY